MLRNFGAYRIRRPRNHPDQPPLPATPTSDAKIIAAARAATIARRDWENLKRRAFNAAAKEARKKRTPKEALPALVEKHIKLELTRLHPKKR